MASKTLEQDDKREAVISAATRCIERLGSQRTSMADIAKEAGIARITLYRMFEDRSALFEALLSRRHAAKLEQFRAHLKRYDSLAQALVDGGMFALELGWADEVQTEIIARGMDHSLEVFMLNNNPELRARHQSVWQAAFQKARASGELTSGLPDERLIEGVRSILNLVLLRSDLNRAEQRQFLQDFLVPAIMGG